MTTIRTDRMMNSLPDYYQFSTGMLAIQAAIADEYDSQEEKDLDLQAQLYISTATWGLIYWEYILGIPTIATDPYDIRRSRVLSAWRGLSAQFNAKLVEVVCEAYSNGETEVTIDCTRQMVHVKFVGTKGIPPNIEDLKAAVENIVHAHLGTEFEFMYSTWDSLENAGLIFTLMDTYTWDSLETIYADTI